MLKEKFDISIVGGFGHVGLPLGLMFASKNIKTLLIDIDKNNFNKISKGEMPFIEYGSSNFLKKTIKNKKLQLSLNLEDIKKSKYIILAIGTPIDEYLNPELSNFLELVNQLSQIVKKSQILIIRSSIYPNMFDKIKKIMPKYFKNNILYCPERIQQGYALIELEKLPQIISGDSKSTIKKGKDLFLNITKKVIITSVKEAEFIKLFSNAFRYIHFAIANEFYTICESNDLNYERVRKYMVESYPRAQGLPMAGFAAGPCLLKDTMQLSSFFKNKFQLGLSAMNINEGLPNFIVSQLKKNYNLNDLNVGILGMSFKANIDDQRDSLSFKLKKILEFEGAVVMCNDTHLKKNYFVPIKNILNNCKIIIVATPHKSYKKIKINKNQILIDPWSFVE